MLIPIRCFTCGKPIAHLKDEFDERVEKGENVKKIFDDFKLRRFCCRALFMGHVDLIDDIGSFRKQ